MEFVKKFFRYYYFLKPIDIIVALYFSVLNILILFCRARLDGYLYYVGLHLLFMIIMFFYIKYTYKTNNKLLKFFRNFYPIIFSSLIYKELDNFMLIFSPYWLDGYIINFEYFICGFHPTVLMQKMIHPLVTEILKFSYFSYYFLVFVPALYLYFTKKTNIFNQYMETLAIAFYVCYIGFILFPVRGPRYELFYLHNVPLVGWFFTNLQDLIMKNGSTYGGCMPSSHVAVSSVAWRIINMHFKKLSYYLLPLLILLCFSTVYHRYHYFSDVIAGIFIAWLSLYLRDIYFEFNNKLKFGTLL